MDDFRPLKYVARRAYELASTGRYPDFVSIEEAIIAEGYAESVPWLEMPGVIASISEICAISREQKPQSEPRA